MRLSPSDPPAQLFAELLLLRPDIARIVDGSRQLDPLEDRVQKVIERGLRYLPTYTQDHPNGLKPWISRIAQNVKFAAHRSRLRYEKVFRRDDGHADRTPASDPSPERAYQLKQAREKLSEAIRDMPASWVAVLYLVCIEGETHEAAAKQLGITEDAAKMKLSRARKFIRERIDSSEYYSALPPDLPGSDGISWLQGLPDITYRGGHLWAGIMAALMLWPSPPRLVARAGITCDFRSVGIIAAPDEPASVTPEMLPPLPLPAPSTTTPRKTRTSTAPAGTYRFQRKGLGIEFRRPNR